jgi:hypothetical protein
VSNVSLALNNSAVMAAGEQIIGSADDLAWLSLGAKITGVFVSYIGMITSFSDALDPYLSDRRQDWSEIKGLLITAAGLGADLSLVLDRAFSDLASQSKEPGLRFLAETICFIGLASMVLRVAAFTFYFGKTCCDWCRR